MGKLLKDLWEMARKNPAMSEYNFEMDTLLVILQQINVEVEILQKDMEYHGHFGGDYKQRIIKLQALLK